MIAFLAFIVVVLLIALSIVVVTPVLYFKIYKYPVTFVVCVFTAAACIFFAGLRFLNL